MNTLKNSRDETKDQVDAEPHSSQPISTVQSWSPLKTTKNDKVHKMRDEKVAEPTKYKWLSPVVSDRNKDCRLLFASIIVVWTPSRYNMAVLSPMTEHIDALGRAKILLTLDAS